MRENFRRLHGIFAFLRHLLVNISDFWRKVVKRLKDWLDFYVGSGNIHFICALNHQLKRPSADIDLNALKNTLCNQLLETHAWRHILRDHESRLRHQLFGFLAHKALQLLQFFVHNIHQTKFEINLATAQVLSENAPLLLAVITEHFNCLSDRPVWQLILSFIVSDFMNLLVLAQPDALLWKFLLHHLVYHITEHVSTQLLGKNFQLRSVFELFLDG